MNGIRKYFFIILLIYPFQMIKNLFSCYFNFGDKIKIDFKILLNAIFRESPFTKLTLALFNTLY